MSTIWYPRGVWDISNVTVRNTWEAHYSHQRHAHLLGLSQYLRCIFKQTLDSIMKIPTQLPTNPVHCAVFVILLWRTRSTSPDSTGSFSGKSLPLNCNEVHPRAKLRRTPTLTALDGSFLQCTVSSWPLQTFWFLSLKF